jgi:BASS family bile acid:Na+ symporter
VNAVTALFNTTVLVMVVSTMLVAGFASTAHDLVVTFKNVPLVVLVFAVNLVAVPLLGWGIAAMLSLPTSAYVALVLIASSPGAPFGAKLAMMQHGDVVTTAAFQVGLAAVGSVTFPVTANWIISAAGVGSNISLPVGDLVKTVVVLQLVPFAVGFSMRRWSSATADEWRPWAAKASNLSLLAVLALSLLGSWKQVVDLVGSRALLGGLLFVAAAGVVGTLASVGPQATRTSVGLLATTRNGGPVMTAIGIAFANDPAILAANTGILLAGMVVSFPFASYLAKRRESPETTPAAVAPVPG